MYDVMADVNPEGLEERGGVGLPKGPKRTSPQMYAKTLMLHLILFPHCFSFLILFLYGHTYEYVEFC